MLIVTDYRATTRVEVVSHHIMPKNSVYLQDYFLIIVMGKY